MVHPRRFVRETLGVAASQYVARVVLLARGLVAAAVLGPFGYGGWNALNLIFDYGSYASAGALQGLDLALPAAVADEDRARARRLMAGAWAIVTSGSVVFSLGLAFYLVRGGRAFSALPTLAMPVAMLAAALMQLALQYLASALRAHGRIHAVSAGLATQAVVGGGLGLVLVRSLGIWGLLIGWLTGTTLAVVWMRRSIPEAPLLPRGLATGRTLVASGFPIFAFFASTLMMRSVDRLALVRFGTPDALGLYAVGLMAAATILYLPESVAYVLFPRMAAAHQGARDPAATLVEANQVHRGVALILPALVALGMVWAEPILARVLPAFQPGVPALLILASAAMLTGAATVPGYYLLASGHSRRMLVVGVAAAVVNGVLAFSVASRDPRPEAVAAAVWLGHGLFAFTIVWLASRAWKRTPWRRVELLVQTFLPALVAGALVVGTVRWFPHIDFGSAFARTLVVLAGYAPLAWWLGRGAGLSTLVREWFAARRDT